MKKLLKTGKPRKTKKNSITFEINKKKNERGFEHRECGTFVKRLSKLHISTFNIFL